MTTNRITQAKQIDRDIQTHTRGIAVATLALGKLFRTMRDEELWFELGYQDFGDYCSRAAGMGEAAASMRIHVADAFKGISVPAREILPITKMAIICPVVSNASNASAWMKKGRKMNCAQLRRAVREHKQKLRAEGKLVDLPTARFCLMGLSFTEKEDATVRKAIHNLKEEAGIKTHGEAIATLARIYLQAAKQPKLAVVPQ